jgi:peptidyl-prolyl cis-trans isomerase D
MLQFIRSRITGVLALTILGLIVLSFVFFGVATPGGTQGLNYAAKVNGVELPMNTYRQQLQRAENQYSQYYPDGIPEEQRAQLRQNILDSMIREELVQQRVYKDRYIVSNKTLLDQLKNVPQFQLNGVFDRNVYEQQLRIAGQSPGQFERSLKNSLGINQLRQALANSAFVSPQDLLIKQQLENENRKASYAVIPASKYKAEISVTDDDIAKEYESTKSTHLTNEQVDIEYIELTSDDLAKEIIVDSDKLAEYYQDVSFRYGSAEERAASHILVSADDGNLEKKKAEAQGLLDQIKSGSDFGELAKAHSDDPVSAAANGDLGLFGKGAMVPEFEEAVFSMKVDEVSDLVKTQYGFHIIKLTEIKESSAPTFTGLSEEQVKELEDEYRKLQVEGVLAERAEEIANEVFDARDTLEQVAQANGLAVKTQKNIIRNTYSGIATNQIIKDAAFSDELRDGTNSDLLAVSAEHAVFLRVTDYRDVRQKSLEEVKQALRVSLEQKAASDRAREVGVALQAEINSIDELKTKAEEDAYSFTEETLLTRNHPGIKRELLTAIFQATKPVNASNIEQGVEMNNGDYAIFYLTEVIQAENSEVSETEKEAAMRALSAQSGNNELSAYLASLREKADIVIPKEQEPVNN